MPTTDPTRQRVKCDACGTVAQIAAPEEGDDGWLYLVERQQVPTKVKGPDGNTHELEVEVPVNVARTLDWKCPNPECGAVHTITEELAR